MNLNTSLLPCVFAVLMAGAARADLIPPAPQRVSVPITVVDDRPFLAASANGVTGLALFDNGTPFALLLNRAFVPLDEGTAEASGAAASGQAVQIRQHANPGGLRIGGVDPGAMDSVLSADLAFVAEGLGIPLIGFVGTPMVDRGAFALDYDKGRVVFIGTAPDGNLADAPDPAEVVADVPFLLPSGDQPLFAGTVGGQAVLIDVDTGDVGTLYLSPAAQTAWRSAGLLTDGPEGTVLRGLAFGGAAFGPVPVRLVAAGGMQDHRTSGKPDLLRLGGRFLRQHPTLWNLAGHRLVVLRPGSSLFAE